MPFVTKQSDQNSYCNYVRANSHVIRAGNSRSGRFATRMVTNEKNRDPINNQMLAIKVGLIMCGHQNWPIAQH